MNLVRCKKGHYYDGDKYAACPHCAQKDITANNTVRMENNVDTEETEQRRNVHGKALKDAVLDALEKKRESELQQVRGKKTISGEQYPTGILVVVGGSRIGKIYSLEAGYNYIGFLEDDIVVTKAAEQLTDSCAIISYHEERNMFILKPFCEESIVQVGRMVVRENMMLRSYDKIVIKGETLLFVPICGEHFKWE